MSEWFKIYCQKDGKMILSTDGEAFDIGCRRVKVSGHQMHAYQNGSLIGCPLCGSQYWPIKPDGTW